MLDYNEERDNCGPCIGCCGGCARFWCCCRGCVTTYQRHQDRKAACLDAEKVLAQGSKPQRRAVHSEPPEAVAEGAEGLDDAAASLQPPCALCIDSWVSAAV